MGDQAAEAAALIEQLGGAREGLLEGYRIKMLDGNCLAASEHRLKALRGLSAGALPGKSLVVYDPALGLATDVLPCEEGHAQERALLGEVLPRVSDGECWVGDRNFCVSSFLSGIQQRDAYFVVREHEQLRFRPLEPMREIGPTETGAVSEQAIELIDQQGRVWHWRRIRVQLTAPTRDGDERLTIWTNLPSRVEACTVAKLYRKRWTIETAFQDLERNLNSEINTLAYPRAALFGFCVALVAYNTLAVLQAALRREYGTRTVDNEVSGYYLAEEISATYRGMMIALPPPEWLIFRHLPLAEMAALLLELARQVDLSAFQKHRRGPKKPQPQRKHDPHRPHVSTARLLAERHA